MKGHQTSGEWTEVRRRKTNKTTQRNTGTTNYYVSGFPDGTKKEEPREPFSRFGNVVDIYFGLKKDYLKRNFSFVRYVGITNPKDTETKLQGIKCRNINLEVSISKHQRKDNQYHNHETCRQPTIRQNMQSNAFHGAPSHFEGMRGQKSYAQVINNMNGKKTKEDAMLITLNPNTSMKGWLKKGVLIGETLSLDHMANLHASGIMKEETKYLGGLKLAIRFRWSVDANEYLKDKNRWNDWFKWPVNADQYDSDYERVAWLKIIGVPLPLWDEDNFSKIASRFGKVITPFDGILDRRDYSMDDWSLFKPALFDKVEESNEEEDDPEGITETWMEDVTDELEEGDIRLDKTVAIGGRPNDNRTSANDNRTPAVVVPPSKTPVTGEIGYEESPINAPMGEIHESTHDGVLTSQNTGVSLDIPNEVTKAQQEPPVPIMDHTSTIGPHINHIPGTVENLVPLGCFGQFPNNTTLFLFKSPQAQNTECHSKGTNSGGPKLKKRKRDKSTVKSSHPIHSNQTYNSNLFIRVLQSEMYDVPNVNLDLHMNLTNDEGTNIPGISKETSQTT
ncbi:unnamed protein product [Lactuca virosa]|uniref:RRM domain-containing protein n=1 Tax=Lactuca virosa TaxID=75947 RepID=A0AAU9NLZ6_9ASTR|nr:unnamed protein product [Lactuca virosa]